MVNYINLGNIEPGSFKAEQFVEKNLADLVCDKIAASSSIRGGQRNAQKALEALDISGYKANRTIAYPESRRGATKLSPYIRTGLIQLGELWDRFKDLDDLDAVAFKNELLWQEYSRHWYFRLGSQTKQGTRYSQVNAGTAGDDSIDSQMGCMQIAKDELEEDGWLVNSMRLWFASQWSNRQNNSWQSGEDYFYSHLLDGSRATNRLGWQWASGVGSSKPYQFTRWLVEANAPSLCASCDLALNCPIENESEVVLEPVDSSMELVEGQAEEVSFVEGESPKADVVWLTPDSMGVNDPAMLANPGLPVAFVFDESILKRPLLSSKRLIFWLENLAEIEPGRLSIYRGSISEVFKDSHIAATQIPVPNWQKLTSNFAKTSAYKWQWLLQPNGGTVKSFSSWISQYNL